MADEQGGGPEGTGRAGGSVDDVEVTLHLSEGTMMPDPPGMEGGGGSLPPVKPSMEDAQAPAKGSSALPPPTGPRLSGPDATTAPPAGPQLTPPPSGPAPLGPPPGPGGGPPGPPTNPLPGPPSNPLPRWDRTTGDPTTTGRPAPVGADAATGVLGIVTGVLVLAGSFLPMFELFGFESTWGSGWGRTATVVTALALVGGGAAAFSSRIGGGVAAGAGLTFVGIYALAVHTTMEAFDAGGGEASIGLGFAAWSLAALASIAVVVLGLTSLKGTAASAWPFVAGAVGIGLFWVGLFVGTDLVSDSGGANVAMAILLLGLPVAGVVAVAVRTPAAAGLAIGTACPWVASWLVYAVDGGFGGLPVPYPEVPLVAGLTVLAMLCLGGVWAVPAVGAGGFAGAGASTVGAAQVAAIVICASVAVVTVGGTATAVSDSRGEAFATDGGVSFEGEPSFNDGTSGTSDADGGSFDESTSGGSSGATAADPGATPSDGFEPEDCTDPVACPEADQTGTAAAPYSPPPGRWVVILGSVFFSEGQGAIEARYDQLLGGFPDAEVLDSNAYTSLRPDVWAVYIDRNFVTGDEAASHCRAIGLPSSQQCYGRYLSDEPGLDWQDPSLIANP